MKRLIIKVAALILPIATGSAEASWVVLDAPGATQTLACGIDDGNIVGYYTDASGDHGFLYDGVDWTTLDVPGARGTQAWGIHGDNIVGYFWDTSEQIHGFLYDGVRRIPGVSL